MAKFTRIAVIQTMNKTGIIPVFYNRDLESFEFTNRGDYAQEVFKELNKYAEDNLPGMILGVGSVIDAATTALYLQLGANFVVSPLLNAEMAKICNRRMVAWLPGCGSVTEINYAQELGADIVKIFPGAQVGGPDFVRAVSGPLPWSNIMPTGGVSPTKESLDYDKVKQNVQNAINIAEGLRI